MSETITFVPDSHAFVPTYLWVSDVAIRQTENARVFLKQSVPSGNELVDSGVYLKYIFVGQALWEESSHISRF